jgi:hypothetical protein
MQPHENCKGWEYDRHPRRPEVTQRCDRLARVIVRRPRYFDRFGHDTRPGHAYMFNGMAPQKCKCIVGAYRGHKNCPALTQYSVMVDGDNRVGVPPARVGWHMNQFEAQCRALEKKFTEWMTSSDPKPSAEVALFRYVAVLAEVLERLFTIHPYANGNGHAGRLLILVLMARVGIHPARWSIDAKQPYGDALAAHRRGNKVPLQDFILDAIIGTTGVGQAQAQPA